MANSYSRLYIHVVFSVKYRLGLLNKTWRASLFSYIAAIIENKGCKAIIVNGVEDHVHLLIGLKPTTNLADLVRDVKCNSAKYINDRHLVMGRFSWAEGYGAFSYAHSELGSVYNYILDQEQHHQKLSFRDEYLALLKQYHIDFDMKYVFDNP